MILNNACKKEVDAKAESTKIPSLKSGGGYTEDEWFSGINQFLPKAVWDSNNFNTMTVDRALRYLEAGANVRLSHTDSFSVAWIIDSVDVTFSYSSSDSGLLISGSEIFTLNKLIYDTSVFFAQQADFNNLEDKFIKVIDLKWANESGDHSYISAGTLRVVTYTGHVTAAKPCDVFKSWNFRYEIPFDFSCDDGTPGYIQMKNILNSPLCNPQNCQHLYGVSTCNYIMYADIEVKYNLAYHWGHFNECVTFSALSQRIDSWRQISENQKPHAWIGSSNVKRILHNYQIPLLSGSVEEIYMHVTYANCYRGCSENPIRPFFKPSE